MMPSRDVLTLLSALAGGAMLTGCGLLGSGSFRYRTTVTVETPQGLRSGSAVRQIIAGTGSWPIPLLGESRGQVRVRGEAVAVDLPGGRTLYALLKSDSRGADHAGPDMFFLFRELGGPSINLWPNPPVTHSPIIRNPVPMLVTFADESDPVSVQLVEPGSLAAAFEPGVRLQSVTVELTEDAVTKGLEERLGWLAEQQGALLKIPLSQRPPYGTPLPLAANLTERDFQQGMNR